MSMSTNGLDAIVIGGSAGALEALSMLLPALPADTAVAVAIVVHLPPTKPSHLAEVLGNKTRLPVKEVEDKEPVAPGTVYVAPPGYHLLIEKGRTFALSTDELVHFSRPAIDVLFESASEAYGDRLAGIILTGSNADGARGLAAIKGRGGLAIVQSPEGALVATMPEAAIAIAHADRVLPVEGIAALLGTLAGGARPAAQEPR
jgi:two-component system, chemotaxis family, protein-glutamate methylesterase/glutaminase